MREVVVGVTKGGEGAHAGFGSGVRVSVSVEDEVQSVTAFPGGGERGHRRRRWGEREAGRERAREAGREEVGEREKV